jgi:hypothetical protein
MRFDQRGYQAFFFLISFTYNITLVNGFVDVVGMFICISR